MRSIRTPTLIVLAGVLVAAGARVAHADVVIDTFGDDPLKVQVINLADPDPLLVETADGAILGGERDLLLNVLGLATPTSYLGSVGMGTLAFNSNSPGSVAILQYDGVDADTVGPPAMLINSEGLGSFDLTDGGTCCLMYLDFLGIEGGAANTTSIEIEVHGVAGSSLFTGTIPDSTTPFRYEACFPDFVGDDVCDAVTSIEVRLNPSGADAVDFELDEIGVALPEPATLGLMGLGLAATLMLRRKR